MSNTKSYLVFSTKFNKTKIGLTNFFHCKTQWGLLENAIKNINIHIYNH